MIPAAVLALLAASAAQPELLAQARAAFDAGAYARAAELALAAAGPEGAQDADALYLAGLASFRDGHPAEALALLDRSGPRGDGPEPWQYNRGACLDALGRYAEAEAAFLAAARDHALSTVALVNAGYAALSRGAIDQALAHAALARGAATHALDLVADLEREVAQASATARAEDARATAATAQRRWTVIARVEAGQDSNALQTGAAPVGERPGATSPDPSSPVATTDLAASARFRPGGDLELEVGYGFGQLAYAAAAARDRSVQQHDLVLALEAPAGARLRLGAAATAQLAFTGLSDFRGMQSAAGVRGWATLAWDHLGSSRLELAWTRKDGAGSEFAYLDGDRLEATLTQAVPLGPVALRLGYRFVSDAVGAVDVTIPPGPCGFECTATAHVPFGYASHTGWLALRWAPWRRLVLDLSGGLEWRRYREDDVIVLDPSDGPPFVAWQQRREDVRLLTSALVSLSLTSRLSVLLRHELVVDRSNLSGPDWAGGFHMGMEHGGGAESIPVGDPSYRKSVFSLGLAFTL